MVVIGWIDAAAVGERSGAEQLRQMLLQSCLGEGVALRRTENGRPEADLPGVDLSTSHADGMAAVALSLPDAMVPPTVSLPPTVQWESVSGEYGRIGLDIEGVDRREASACLAVAGRWFSPAEQMLLNSLPAVEIPQAFCRMWTQKESYLKLTGEGLAALRRIDTAQPPAGIRFFTEERETSRGRFLRSLCVPIK